MDFALDQGVNFWDTAELYAVPPKKETYGDTEEIIGKWLKKVFLLSVNLQLNKWNDESNRSVKYHNMHKL